MKRCFLFLLAGILQVLPLPAKDYSLLSPSGRLQLTLSVGEKTCWSLAVDGETVLKDNAIGMHIEDRALGTDVRVLKQSKGKKTEHIVSPFYRQAEFNTSYNWLTLKMKGDWSLELRAYDDGVAYRFVTNRPDIRKVYSETAEFNFAEPYKMLVPFVRKRNDGDRYRTSFENLYAEVAVGDIDTADGRLAFMPVYVDIGEKGRLLLMESDLWDYPGMFLRTTCKGFEAEFPPYPNNIQVQDAKYLDYLNMVAGTRAFPWRVIAYGASEKELAVNNMVYQLASPCKIEDLSWIRPGKSTWDWWNGYSRHGVDFNAVINTETYLYDVDFAARYGLSYILIDDGWYKNKNIFTPIDGLDIARICSYAAEKGVKVLLWVSKGVLGLKPEKAFAHYASLGVAGFKVDFFDSQEAAMVNRINMYAEAAARYHLLLDFHGIFKPVGLNRTYPNVINYEGVYGLENMKWCDPKTTDMPRNDVTIPFVRQAAGPMDYTPGALRNASEKNFRAIDSRPMSQGTRAHQLACYVVFDAPLQMLCDSPSDYLKEDETSRWIASIPTVFDRTVILDGKIGEFVVSLREKDGCYYVGGMTDWHPRDICIDFGFLPEGEWKCRIFKDGINAGLVGEDYTTAESEIGSGHKETVHLAPGGGFVMIIEKK